MLAELGIVLTDPGHRLADHLAGLGVHHLKPML